MSSKRRLEGYLMIDNRGGPGVSEEFLRHTAPQKWAPTVGEGQLYESPTITCSHCNTVVILNPLRTRERGHCFKCDAYICDNPLCHKECNPVNKQLDDAEKRALIDLARHNVGAFSLNQGVTNGKVVI